jgi:hypothetical protein
MAIADPIGAVCSFTLPIIGVVIPDVAITRTAIIRVAASNLAIALIERG